MESAPTLSGVWQVDSVSARTYLFRLVPSPQGLEKLFNAVIPALQIEPSQQALNAGGGAVLLHGGVLGHRGLAGIFAAAQHGGLGLGLERLTARLLGENNVRETCLFPRDQQRIEP